MSPDEPTKDEDEARSPFFGRRTAIYILLANLAIILMIAFSLPMWTTAPPAWAYQGLLAVAAVLVIALGLLTRRPTIHVADSELLRRDDERADT